MKIYLQVLQCYGVTLELSNNHKQQDAGLSHQNLPPCKDDCAICLKLIFSISVVHNFSQINYYFELIN